MARLQLVVSSWALLTTWPRSKLQTRDKPMPAPTFMHWAARFTFCWPEGHLLATGAHRTFVQKVVAHANEDIVPVDRVRPDVPGPLAASLDRMVAKNPAHRYATAAEVAESLAPFCVGSDLVRRLANRGVARPVTPRAPKVADSAPPDTLLKSPKASAVPAVTITHKAWLIGLALLAIAALWYGIGFFPGQSTGTMGSPEQNPNGGMAQLPPSQGDVQRQGGPQACAEVRPVGKDRMLPARTSKQCLLT